MKAVDAWKLMPDETTGSRKSPRINVTGQNVIDDFASVFSNSLKKVNSLQTHAENIEKSFVAGEVENVHEVMIAAEKAKMALEFTIEVRNKLIEAYKTFERMPV